jgi:hypothetical protein
LDQGWEEIAMKDEDINSWDDVKRRHHEYIQAKGSFLKNPSAALIIKRSLAVPEDRALALDLISNYPDSESVEFFSQLISLASYVNGFTETCQDLILGLPREWVMRNVETAIDEILADGDYEEYRCLLELCCKLDRELMIKIARRASSSLDEDIKEAGADFLLR